MLEQDEIIEMARQAGMRLDKHNGGFVDASEIKRFAKLVAEAAASKEREACAKACEALVPTYVKDGERWLKGQNGKPDTRMKDLAPNLEAAWEAEQLLKNGSVIESYTTQHKCADAIRARGEV